MPNDFFATVNGAALSKLPSLLSEWFPAGHLAGREFECGDVNGTPGRSFKVNTQTGAWADFAGVEKGGDPVSLYAARHGLKQGEAALRLGRELGLEPPKLRATKQSWQALTPVPPDAPDPTAKFPRWNDTWGRPVAAWLYLDAEGRRVNYRVRFETSNGDKDVIPLSWCRNRETGETAWRWMDIPASRSLYGIEKLAARPDAPILIVQGEKKVDTAEALLPGWVSLSYAGGDKRASSEYTDWKPLLSLTGPARAQTKIRIWPDNDDSGKHAALAIAMMFPASADVKIVAPDPTWPATYDIADLAADGWDCARLERWIEEHSVSSDAPPNLERPRVLIGTQDHGVLQDLAWQGIKELNARPEGPRYFFVENGLSGELRLVQKFGSDSALVGLDAAGLRAYLTRHLYFYVVNQKWGERGETPPTELLMSLTRAPSHELPRLRRFVRIPIFVPDGRLIATPGFDARSGIYYAPSPGLENLTISDDPTTDDLENAKIYINDLLHDFPFAAPADRAHAWALMLLPVVRELIDGPTPLHRVEAPDFGTGKTLLMNVLLKPGVTNPITLPETDDEEEWRKVMVSALRDGAEAILIDNCRNLNSGVLASILTARVWGARILGANEIPRYPVNCIFACTVNNPEWSREMNRRMVRIRLDAKVEDPFKRQNFKHAELLTYAERRRPELLRALLTVAAYGLRHPGARGPLKGSFEAWSRVMGGILSGVGIEGFGDVHDDMDIQDIRQQAMRGFVKKWWETYGTQEMTSAQLYEIAREMESLELRGEKEKGLKISFGRRLREYRDRIIDGKMIIFGGVKDGYPLFRLREI
jgi:hypothetical protein